MLAAVTNRIGGGGALHRKRNGSGLADGGTRRQRNSPAASRPASVAGGRTAPGATALTRRRGAKARAAESV